MSIQEQGKRSGEPVAQIVPGDCRKPLPLGLRGEDLSSVVGHSAIRHISGARAIIAGERAYNGGPSAVDIVDKQNL